MPTRLPAVLQKGDADCGEAVFKAVCARWRVRGAECPRHDPAFGLSPDELHRAFKAAGLRVLAGDLDVLKLQTLTRLDIPVVCLVRRGGVGHYVAVWQVSHGNVRYACPADGDCKEPVAAFLTRFHDVSRWGHSWDRFGMAVWREGAAGVDLARK